MFKMHTTASPRLHSEDLPFSSSNWMLQKYLLNWGSVCGAAGEESVPGGKGSSFCFLWNVTGGLRRNSRHCGEVSLIWVLNSLTWNWRKDHWTRKESQNRNQKRCQWRLFEIKHQAALSRTSMLFWHTSRVRVQPLSRKLLSKETCFSPETLLVVNVIRLHNSCPFISLHKIYDHSGSFFFCSTTKSPRIQGPGALQNQSYSGVMTKSSSYLVREYHATKAFQQSSDVF